MKGLGWLTIHSALSLLVRAAGSAVNETAVVLYCYCYSRRQKLRVVMCGMHVDICSDFSLHSVCFSDSYIYDVVEESNIKLLSNAK